MTEQERELFARINILGALGPKEDAPDDLFFELERKGLIYEVSPGSYTATRKGLKHYLETSREQEAVTG